MKFSIMRRLAIFALSAAIAWTGLAGTRVADASPFTDDVARAIDAGIAYQDSQGVFNNPSNAGWAAGINMLALLEKRASGNPADPAQGYQGASVADQARLRRIAAYVTNLLYQNGFYAYGFGGGLSALTEYLATGGPEACVNPCSPTQLAATPVELQNLSSTVRGAIDIAVDRSLAAQRTAANGWPNDFNQGYWCYNNGGCDDSSTTQYSALGLSAARALYSNPAFGDPAARVPKIDAAMALVRTAYQLHSGSGSQDTGCDPGGWTYTTPDPANYPQPTYPAGYVPNPRQVLGGGTPADPAAIGHGYHAANEGYPPSLQQTASGLFVQLLGGANINDPTVQGYMRWINEHYRYTDIGGLNGANNGLANSWPTYGAYYYYLWSSSKGIEFMTAKGIAANPGNLTTQSYGTLAPTAAPVCTDRQQHLDPSAVARAPLWGANGAGYYAAEHPSQYFDYAYTLLNYQCASGQFACNSTTGLTNPQSFNTWQDGDAYALLVLQRATGVLVPTATLTTSAASSVAGTPVTLTWTSTNASSCAASGGNPGDGWTGATLPANGSLQVNEGAAGLDTYSITCSAGTQTALAEVSVNWTMPTFLMCDVDGNGAIDSRDIQLIMKAIGQHAPPASLAADFDRNGLININDVRNCALRCTLPNCAIVNTPVGPPPVSAPTILGLTRDAAQAAITGAGLIVGGVTSQSNSSVPLGHVVSQVPAGGTSVPQGAPVAFVLSSGPAHVAVPNVVGLAQAAAGTALTGVQLIVGTVQTSASATVPAGIVISQLPAAGASVVIGSAVNLVVSSGPAQVVVPSVVGLSGPAGASTLTGVGLALGNVTQQYSTTVAAGIILSESPAAGTSVAPGAAVDLVVSSGPPPVPVPAVVGMTQAAASAALTAGSLTTGSVATQPSVTVPAGSVISQNPVAGKLLPPGTAVNLVVSSGPILVPNVVGQTQAAASSALTGAGLAVGGVSTASSLTIAAGRVISQNPAAGTGVAAASAVDLVVSSGLPQVLVPDVTGQTQAAAATTLGSVSLTVGTTTTQRSATVPAGSVISQAPVGGTSVVINTAVNLVVSSGPISVPNLVGLSQSAAQSALTTAGLTLGTVTMQQSATVPVGNVMSQSPAAGSPVGPGTAVNVTESSGPAPVTVPNVVGIAQSAAQTAITGAGLTVGTVTTQASATVPSGNVISQNPSAGASVPPTTAVSLVVSTGNVPVSVPNVVGQTQAAASTAITGAGLVVGTVTTQASGSVPAGNVISQSPTAGTSVTAGSSVGLVVSTGPAQVLVPNVVGLSQAAATTAITGATLSLGTVSTQYSPTVPAGNVISQNPAAGSTVTTGVAVNITVSLGTGSAVPTTLVIELSQSVITAGGTINATSKVLDGVGNPIANPPSIDYAVIWGQATSVGTLPGVNGSQVTTTSDTRGGFQLQGTVHGTAVTASVPFTVLVNTANSGWYATFAASQKVVRDNLKTIIAAIGSGNTSAIPPASAALTAAAGTINTGKMALSTLFAPDTGFLPTSAQVAAGGFPQKPSDVAYGTYAGQFQAKVRQITQLLNSGLAQTNVASFNSQLAQLSTDLKGIAANLTAPANQPTLYGVVDNAKLVSDLMAVDMPALQQAMVTTVNAGLHAQGLASTQLTPAAFYASVGKRGSGMPVVQTADDMYRCTADAQLLELAFGAFGDMGELIWNVYGPWLQFLEQDIILLAANSLLQYILEPTMVAGLVTGGDLMPPYAYNIGGSYIDITGISIGDLAGMQVWLVGTEQVAAAQGVVSAIKNVPQHPTNIQQVYDYFQGIVDALQTAQTAYNDSVQPPDFLEVDSFTDTFGCLYSLSDNCVEAIYNSGFKNVAGNNPFGFTVIVLIKSSGPNPQWYVDLTDFAPTT